MLASNPVPTLNQQKADLGIPRDSLKPHPALEPKELIAFAATNLLQLFDFERFFLRPMIEVN
ncbi:MAG: hypothetical protein CR217_12625 [Beijerinckiaceae bacterium]|nr:MAG: hypothetical protein CR217_12625 [Beijerinckiaceae bacterium]